MKRAVLLILILSLVAITLPDSSAYAMNGWMGVPHGDYCDGPGWGWYGARRAVTTPQQAKKILKEYFKGEDVAVGVIRERGHFFEADIKDKKGTVVDRVIIDKRTGRIRSIY
ncbi:MAG: PepSY domain-containing protein [Nitrospirota bacterium]